ncbi:MAG: FecR domain-containing protein [Gammaproteobacteria bacterium]
MIAAPEQIPDDLVESAIIWHTRLRQPCVSEQTRAEFTEWLRGDEFHPAAFAEAERLFGAIGNPAKSVREWHNDRATADAAQVGYRAGARYALAACAAFVAILAGAWWQTGGYDRLRSDAVTHVGETRALRLDDGSEITLNTDTAVSYSLQPQQRTVELLHGEAFFSVAPDTQRPFFVRTNTGVVRVVGTRFNVRVSDSKTLVAVEQGLVEVRSAALSAGGAPRTARLVRGDSAELAREGVETGHADAGEIASWRHGQMSFYGAPLYRVAAELSRYRRGAIIVLPTQLRNLPVTGVFDTRKPDEAIHIIEQTLVVRSWSLPGVTLLY